ncbi:hypothetical protein E2562_029581 [Oryza meyeriana var. granulata]|uniref:Uncharacterized protein n=1 Tax=Oryza meyeriana var. granulata TaxID=110450 RepID=A0A6G1CB84_9ORYZ|nr:hypothetical protein E2562_029581 [Oryza meyeriana var. granulata]
MGEVADIYTQDGNVDVKGKPAIKKNTGNWRACPTYSLTDAARGWPTMVTPDGGADGGGVLGAVPRIFGSSHYAIIMDYLLF